MEEELKEKFKELEKTLEPIVYDLAKYFLKEECLRFHYSVGDILIYIRGAGNVSEKTSHLADALKHSIIPSSKTIELTKEKIMLDYGKR